MTFVLATQCESGNSSFQPEEGPSRGLLRDCKTSRNLREGSLEALVWDNNNNVVVVTF